VIFSAAPATPELHLRSSFVLDDRGRITSTREPDATHGPLFTIMRGASSCAWLLHADVPDDAASAIERLARDEPPTTDFRAPPVNAERYLSILAPRVASDEKKMRESDGPAFVFSSAGAVDEPEGIVLVDDERALEKNFRGWKLGEIAAGRSPVCAIVDDGAPVSICFCARKSDDAAVAGVDTTASHRGRGLAPRVVSAWANAVARSGRVPFYSTAWTNHASLAVARKLALVAHASSWSLDAAPAG
jgi:hypothetical protein